MTDTAAYLRSLPEPPDDELERWDAEPTTTDDLTVEADEGEEWRDGACD